MENLKVVEKLLNTEVLDGLQERFVETKDRLENPSLKIIRKVEPTDDEFKDVQSSIKELAHQNFPKERGSNHLISTVQGLYIVPENESEEKKVSVLNLGLYPANDLWSELNKLVEPETSGLNTLFSNDPKVQRVIFNSEFEPSGSLDGLNDYVTDFDLYPLDCGLPTFSRCSTSYRGDTPSNALLDFLDDGDWLRYSRSDDDRYWSVLTNVLDVDENIIEVDFYETSDERINSIDPSVLFANLSEVNRKLDVVNTQIDAYKDSVSVTYSTFCEVFPEVDEFLENELRKDEEVTLRKSQLKRKTVKVVVTNVYEIEMDVVNDADIEPRLSEEYKEKRERNVGDDFGSLFSSGDHLNQLTSTFDSLSVIDVKDSDQDLQDVA